MVSFGGLLKKLHLRWIDCVKIFITTLTKCGLLAKSSHRFLWHNFNDFMEKESCTKFCGALISSREVMKLQSFESVVSGVIPANIENISSLAFFAYFC